MNYIIFYTGLASTPFSVGLMNLTTGEKIHEIDCSRPSGKETRRCYEKFKGVLNRKYNNLIQN